MPASRASRALALVATATFAACAGGAPGGVEPAPAPAPRAAGVSGERPAIAEARADSARLPYTEADIRFMSSMIGHHAQAIVMARLAPSRAASPSIRVLADRIVNAQRDEIATMQR